MSAVVDNTARHRFELHVDGHVVFAEYRLDGETLVIPHVEAPPALRGKGAAGELMQGMMTVARERGLKVVPLCGYAASWIQRHPIHRDLLA